MQNNLFVVDIFKLSMDALEFAVLDYLTEGYLLHRGQIHL